MKLSTVLVEQPDLSKGARQPPEATPNLEVRAEPVPVPSATTIMAVRPGVIRPAEAPVSGVAHRVAAVEVSGEGVAAVAVAAKDSLKLGQS